MDKQTLESSIKKLGSEEIYSSKFNNEAERDSLWVLKKTKGELTMFIMPCSANKIGIKVSPYTPEE